MGSSVTTVLCEVVVVVVDPVVLVEVVDCVESVDPFESVIAEVVVVFENVKSQAMTKMTSNVTNTMPIFLIIIKPLYSPNID